MKRRNFFKKITGVIAGLVIAPFAIEAKETAGDVNKPIFRVTMRNNNELRKWKNGIPEGWCDISGNENHLYSKKLVNRGGWNCHNQYESGDPKDHRMVLFTADGNAYESKDIILK